MDRVVRQHGCACLRHHRPTCSAARELLAAAPARPPRCGPTRCWTPTAGATVLRQTREHPAGRRLQGAGRADPARRPEPGGAGPRRGQLLHRQPRPVVGVRARRSASAAWWSMPAAANPVKVRAVRALGAEVVAARRGPGRGPGARRAAGRSDGLRLVSPGDTPELMAGVGTAYLEIVETAPDLDVVVVPGGQRDRGRGRLLVTAALAPACRVIARAVLGVPGRPRLVAGRAGASAPQPHPVDGPGHRPGVRTAAVHPARRARRLPARLRRARSRPRSGCWPSTRTPSPRGRGGRAGRR